MAYTTIDKPLDYFETVLYTGNGSTQSITSLDFQPDWVWLKQRNTTRSHWLFDSVRGATKRLHSEATSAEATDTSTLTSFNSNGFSLGSSVAINQSSGTYASWNWKKTATAGFDIFDIIAYTGTGSSNAVSHSLSATPSMIIIKNRDDADSWYVWHQGLGAVASNYINLDTDGAKSSVSDGITAISSSNFTVNTRGDVNASSEKYIAYCFAEKQGFSKFGSYTGNGSTDGTFVYTGMKPSFVMVKRTDTTGNWVMVDSKRDTFNVCDAVVSADISDAEYDIDVEDFLSNGFKMRDTHTTRNASGGTYIYMCFASNPFTTSTGVPATAR
jgi:hypothetical protein